MSAERWLYLPIDVKVRELDGKLFFAACAALRGWTVVVGQKKQVAALAPRLPPGIFSGFGGQENFAAPYAALRARGHRILIFDEEGLVTHNEEIYARTKLCDATLDSCDLFAVWGAVQKEMVLRRKPRLAGRIVVSGSPRIDVLRPAFARLRDEEAGALRARFGRFILFNSNFGSSNHFTGARTYFESLRTKKVIQSGEEERYYQRYFDYRTRVMEAIVAVLPALSAAFPALKIVLRPHPSERAQAWQDAARGLGNVHVVHEGSVVPWIAAAECVLHNFCTTAIESYALGTPVVAYRPVIDESLESPLPTLVSHVATTPDALIATLRRLCDEKPPAPVDPALVQRYARNLGGGPLASDTLLDALDTLPAAVQDGTRPDNSYARLRLRAGLKRLRKALMPATRSREAEAAYIAHKFPGLTRAEIMQTLDRLSSRERDFSGLRITALEDSVFTVRR